MVPNNLRLFPQNNNAPVENEVLLLIPKVKSFWSREGK
jgi:hypothetical protein